MRGEQAPQTPDSQDRGPTICGSPARDPAWRAAVATGSLDPFRGYATALATELPGAVPGARPVPRRAVGAGLRRRRPSPGPAGHHGAPRRAREPLDGIRRVLRRRRIGSQRLNEGRARLETAGYRGRVRDAPTVSGFCTIHSKIFLFRPHVEGVNSMEFSSLGLWTMEMPEICTYLIELN